MREHPKKPPAFRGNRDSYAALARCYDIFTKNMDYKKRTEYLCALLCRAGARKGETILDLACGTGTYTCALLQAGYDVIGADASSDMLQIALEKTQALGLPPPLLLCQRLESLDLYGTARAAVCLTDSLNHLTEPVLVRQFFGRLALFLEQGAPFIFDVNTLYKHEKVLADNTFLYNEKGVRCLWQNRWIPERRTTEITLDIRQRVRGLAYERWRECFAERAYSPEELTEWLAQAGFIVEYIYEELTDRPPSETAERIFFVTRRT